MLDLNELKNGTAIYSKCFDFTLLTPMFMHGWQEVTKNHNNKDVSKAVNAELRGPSLRGILRYWWRSLQPEGLSLATLLKQEQDFFGGSSGGDESGGHRSLLLLKLSSQDNQPIQETNRTARLCPHKPGMLSLSLAPGRRLRMEARLLKKDNPNYDHYVNYCMLTFMLAGLGQRSRRGGGSIQLDDFKWTTVRDFRKTLQEILQVLHLEKEFNFKSRNNSCLLERNVTKDTYPRLMRVWIGKPYETADEAREDISKAGHSANSGNAPQLLGSARRNERLGSPLLGTIRQIGNSYFPVVSEMSNPNMTKDRYPVQRDLFLRSVGVSL